MNLASTVIVDFLKQPEVQKLIEAGKWEDLFMLLISNGCATEEIELFTTLFEEAGLENAYSFFSETAKERHDYLMQDKIPPIDFRAMKKYPEMYWDNDSENILYAIFLKIIHNIYGKDTFVVDHAAGAGIMSILSKKGHFVIGLKEEREMFVEAIKDSSSEQELVNEMIPFYKNLRKV